MAYGNRVRIIIVTLWVTPCLFFSGCKGRAADHYNRAVAYAEKGEYDQAFSEFTKAIEIDSDYADAYVGRGAAYLHKREFEQAISDYTRAIEIDPNHAPAYCGRGIVYSARSEHNWLSDLNEAIKIDSSQSVRVFVSSI